MLIKSGKKIKKTLVQSEIDICYKFLEEKKSLETSKDFYYPCDFWILLIKVLQCTGIRRNQLLHLRICDINEKHQMLFLREEGSKTHFERNIPVINSVFQDIKKLKNDLIRKKLDPKSQLFNIYHFKNDRDKTKEYRYKEMDFNRIDKFFQRLSKYCGVRISPHRFRHTLATNLMKNPERNVTLVKELLGHTSVSTTLEYIETDQDQLRDCLNQHFKQ